MNWYIEGLKKYAQFTGRASRSEYWYFCLISVLISVLCTVTDLLLGLYSIEAGLGPIGAVYSLAIALPTLALTVRRLHDTDRSGWWLLVCFLPILGLFILLYFLASDSTPQTNRFGENPKPLAA